MPTEEIEAVPDDAHSAARKKLINVGGKASALVAAALVLAVGVINTESTDAEGAPSEAAAAYVDLRDDSLTSRGAEVDRDVLNEDRVLVTIEVDGESSEYLLSGGTVGDVLQEAEIAVGSDDLVSEHLGTELVDGMAITVQRVITEVVTEDVVDEHGSSKVDSDSLYKGEENVTTEGVDGYSTTTYRVTLIDGEEAARETLAAVVTQERVDEVISVGTRERPSSGSGGSGSAPSTGPVATGSNREIGQNLAAARGWEGEQWQCLDALWQKESNWNHLAQNPSSGAYGIPQSLPGNKMASVAGDWRTNPATQITWGLNYISGRYGTPCGAWQHSQARNWY